jgi:ATP-dependent Clp protease ATP-binding subunit ClpA
MFERLARESREAIECAVQVARRLGADQVEPEHLLLALAGGHVDPAARALDELGLDAATIEHAIEQDLVAALGVVGVPASVVESTPVYPGVPRPGFSLAVKEALQAALRAVASRGDRGLGTEHLLLGLLDPPSFGLRRLLVALDVEVARIRAQVQVEVAAGR